MGLHHLWIIHHMPKYSLLHNPVPPPPSHPAMQPTPGHRVGVGFPETPMLAPPCSVPPVTQSIGHSRLGARVPLWSQISTRYQQTRVYFSLRLHAPRGTAAAPLHVILAARGRPVRLPLWLLSGQGQRQTRAGPRSFAGRRCAFLFAVPAGASVNRAAAAARIRDARPWPHAGASLPAGISARGTPSILRATARPSLPLPSRL